MDLLNIEGGVPLAPYTTLGIGGVSRLFVRADNEQQVGDAVRFAADSAMPLFVLGGGSNILVSDEGFDGLT
ncbi:MAG: UDP-N-acetylenolpyruvoylglucosamine reductase, partial [Pyrinomonadaceae bacterium]